MEISAVKFNLSAMLHGADIDSILEPDLVLERAANTLLSKIDPIETIRTAALASLVYDDVYNYALPSDYKKIIDLTPQDNRSLWDKLTRSKAGDFDLKKAIQNKVISIEGSEGSKIIRINWKSRKGKVLNTMDSVTANGTWGAVATASGIQADTITKYSGSASIRFDLAASGDGIKNTTMTAMDMTDEDEVADVFVPVYIKNAADLAKITNIGARWGNDVTSNYWTPTAQTTQADGTAFKVGWNIIKFPWSTATETGTVNPAAIDSFQLTLTTTGAITDIRVDNITFTIGRAFDIKYYSKFIIKNTSGTWISRTASDGDTCVLDNDGIQLFLLEGVCAIAQQDQNNAYDISWAKQEMNGNGSSPDPEERRGLYAKYRGEFPSQARKQVSNYGFSRPFRNRRANF